MIRAVLSPLLGLTLAACAPNSDTSQTDVGTTTGATTEPTTGGPGAGCAGADRAACEASSPLVPDEHACFWANAYAVSATCEVTAVQGECLEINLIEGGASCEGFFREGPDGAERLESLDCFEPIAGDWELCFPELDSSEPAHPICACAVDMSCGAHADQATCEALASTFHPCSWEGDQCDST